MTGDGSERSDGDRTAPLRRRMVEEQLVARRIDDRRVLDAMGRIPRHEFVDGALADQAYGDFPVPIGHGQTLSQPYVVALMTEALALDGSEKVLEIGTGSGYQTAVLAELAREVYSIELVSELAESARSRLEAMGYRNIRFRTGDGRGGWPDAAPFDAILVAAAPVRVPPALLEQLSEQGRLVVPVGPSECQQLDLYWRDATREGGFREENLGSVRFVPLV